MSTRSAIPVLVAGLSILWAGGAGAERVRTEQPAPFCFEIVARRGQAEPGGPILLDKCTGKTWLLVRHDGGRRRADFRWKALAFDAAPRPDAAEPRMAPRFGGQKCFVFSGHRYCEE